MKKYFKYFAIFTAVLLFNCESDDGTTLTNYVGFETDPLSLKVTKDATSTIDISVYASEKVAAERSYSLQVDATSSLKANYVVPATVTIPANSNVGTFTVSVTDDDTLAFIDQTLVIGFKGEPGTNFGDKITVNVSEACLNTFVTVALSFDSWPEETTIELYDLSGDEPVVIYEGGPYNGRASASISFCLTAGDYGLVVYDAFGDGGCTYQVSSATTVYVPKTTSKSAQAVETFTIN